MSIDSENLRTARRYLQAIEQGVVDRSAFGSVRLGDVPEQGVEVLHPFAAAEVDAEPRAIDLLVVVETRVD